MTLSNRISIKKDSINITPFLDIILVLFVIIIVVFSKNNYNFLSDLEKKIEALEKENELLIQKNSILNERVKKFSFLEKNNKKLVKENKKLKKIIDDFTVKVAVYQNYLTINGVRYSISDFKKLVSNNIIRKVHFYYYDDGRSFKNFQKLKKFLKELGWNLK